jgi:multiple sugar transport system substrate-binding protein
VSILATINHSLDSYDPYIYEEAAELIPNIDLTIDVTAFGGGWDGYANNLVTRLAGGEGVDVVYMAIEGMPLLSEQNTILPMDEFLDGDPEAKADFDNDIHPTLWETLTWKGKIMMIPYGWNNMLNWFNPRIFEELGVDKPEDGWDWDEFVQTCKDVADVTGSDDDRYAYVWFDSAFGMAPWYFNNDTSWLKNDWQDSNMDDPKVVEVLQHLQDLILVHKVSPQLAGFDEAGQFHAGNLVMRGCGRWCTGQARNAEFKDYDFEYYPHKSGPLKTVIGVGGWSITTISQHPAEAWEAIKVIDSYEQGIRFITQTGSVSARRSVAESDEFLSGEHLSPEADMRMFYQSLDFADVVPSPPNFNVVDPLLRRWYAQLWNGDITPDELVAGAHPELQAEMDAIKT